MMNNDINSIQAEYEQLRKNVETMFQEREIKSRNEPLTKEQQALCDKYVEVLYEYAMTKRN